MALNQPLTREIVTPSCKAFLEFKDKKAAAASIGIARNTLCGHLTWAAINAPDLLGIFKDFTPPTLPPEDESVDTTIERLTAEQRRRETYRAATEWMKFTVEDPTKPFALAFVGDPHIDVCDIITLRKHVDTIMATPRMWAVGLGDWINNWQGRLRGQYANQTTTERQAFALIHWLINKPDLWWLLINGNHDKWTGHGNPIFWMTNASAVSMVQEWAVKFAIQCGDHTWRVSAAHNFPGHSMYNVNHGPKKRAMFTGAEADIFVAGDRHTFGLAQDQHEHTGKIYWTVRSRGYKALDDYAKQLGHEDAGGENGIGHSCCAVFDPRDGTVQCFAVVERAASYLKFLLASVE